MIFDHYALTKSLACYVFIIAIVLLAYVDVSFETLSAASDSFPLQGIYDLGNDSALVRNDLMNLSECLIEGYTGYPETDIRAAGYRSDGEFLYGRLWLNSHFKEPDTTDSANFIPIQRSYNLLVDIESAYDIGQTYQYVVEWDALTPMWKSILAEGPPPSLGGPLNIIYKDNYTHFYDGGQRYIDLSLNLSTIGFPDRYSVLAYVSDTYYNDDEKVCHLIDITDVVHVPPPEFTLTASPNTVLLRPGEEGTLELKIANTNTKLSSHMVLSSDEIPKGFNITFTPAEISIPPEGVSSSAMRIKVDETVSSRAFTVPINAEIRFPTTVSNSLIKQSLYNAPSAKISENYDVTVTVLEPITLQEQVTTFMDDWSSLYYIAGAFVSVVTIVSGILGWKIWTKSKKRRERTLD